MLASAKIFTFLPKALDWGNRCGHTPDVPDLALRLPANGGTLSEDGKRRGGIPLILTELMSRLEQYYWKPSIIPSLNLANGSSRQQRSERREACLKTLAAMIKYLDLTTLKVGIPHPHSGEFQNLTLPFLAAHAGLSLHRVKRAVKDLKRAGLITMAPLCEPDGEGGFRGLAAVKAVRQELFAIFGLIKRLKFDRDRASKRLKKRQDAARQQRTAQKGTLGDLARLKSMIQGLLGSESSRATKAPRASLGAPESAAVMRERQRVARLRKLIEERPDLRFEQIVTILNNEPE